MNPTSNYQYNIHELLKVTSNCKEYIPPYFSVKSKSDQSDIILTISNEFKLPSKFTKIGHDLFCSESKDHVISKVSLFGYNAFLSIKRLKETPTEISISNNYRLLSKTLLKIPISTVFPDQAFAQMILHVKLLLKNHTFLVSSCFKPHNHESAIAISSIGGMGKTSTIFEALKKIGGEYFADDMIIVNENGAVYSYPKSVRIRKIPGPFSIETYKTPAQLLGSNNKIGNMAPIGKILLLERGTKNAIKQLESKEAASKLLVITRKLLPYYMERTLLAYSYISATFDPFKLMTLESMIISKFTEQAKCYVLVSQSGTPNSYVKLMRDLL